LIHRFKALSNDLNTSTALRLSVVVAYLVVASVLMGLVLPWMWLAAPLLLGILVALNFAYYRWFARKRGLLFALGVVPVHLVHHLCNGLSFVVGTGLHLGARLGIRLPGALPSETWTPSLAASALPRAHG
jgi:hypothetical protein